jgi:hypothetical protein
MKTLFIIGIQIGIVMTTLCHASQDALIPVSGRAIHFSSQEVSAKILFNVDVDRESNFSSITIEYNGHRIEVDSSELGIKAFAQLDVIQLFRVPGKSLMYLRIVDSIGKGRREDCLYFSDAGYLKRVTILADDGDKVIYSTKMKGGDEVPGCCGQN